MKRFSLIIITAVGIATAGCALQKDVYSLQTRLTQLERRTMRMENTASDAESIRSQIDQVTQERQSDYKTLRNQFAAAKADIDRMQDEVNRLRGDIEAVQFNKSQQQNEAEKIDPKTAEKVAMLTQELEQTKLRLTQVENYLDLDTPKPQEVAADTSAMAGDEALYSAAKTQFDQGHMKEARAGFEKLLKGYPKSSNADNAQFWIGETYYQEKWYEKAILEYQKVLENYPKGNKVPAAMLKQALAFQKIKDTPNAKLIFKELTQKYPSTSEGKIAAQKLKEF